MISTMAPEKRNGTAEQTGIGRATTVVADVGAQARITATERMAVVVKRTPAALAASRGVIERGLAASRWGVGPAMAERRLAERASDASSEANHTVTKEAGHDH